MPEFEYYASNAKVAYPFLGPLAGDAHKAFVDAAVCHSGERANAGRLRIDTLDLGTGELKLVFEDGTTLCDIVGTSGVHDFGSYRIFEWRHVDDGAVPYVGAEVLARLVMRIDAIGTFPVPWTPAGAWLVPSTVVPRVGRLRQFGVGIPAGIVVHDRKFVLAADHNIKLSAAVQAGGRDTTVVTIEAVAGEGTGKYSECMEGDDIKTINNVGPDVKGYFRFEGERCTWMERPLFGDRDWAHPHHTLFPPVHPGTDYLSRLEPNCLRLHSDCKVCCDCDDYKEAYEALYRLWTRALAASRRIELIRRRYQELAAEAWHKVGGFAKEVVLTVKLVSRPGYNVGVAVAVTNRSRFDFTSTSLQFILLPADWKVTDDSGIMELTAITTGTFHAVQRVRPSVVGNLAYVNIPYMPSGSTANYSFEIYWERGAPRVGSMVSATARVFSRSGIEVAQDSIEMKAPAKKT